MNSSLFAKVSFSSIMILVGFSSFCFAQAWIPPKGMGAIAINYQFFQIDDHFTGFGERTDVGHTQANNVIADFSYSLTDKLAVTVGLPFVSTKYEGPSPHILTDGTIPLDDGRWHSTAQDFSFQARYSVLAKPVQITPYVRGIIASNDYEYFGHSAPGVNKNRVQVGTYAGRLLDPIFPNTYLQGGYSYTFGEKILDMRSNYSSLDLELGYFVTPSLRVFGIAAGQVTHSDLDLEEINPRNATNQYFIHHDQIMRVNYLNLGGGASYSINNSIDVYGAVTNTVSGRNVHATKYGITFGVSYGFQGFRPPADVGRASANKGEAFNPVCLCVLKD